MSCQQPILNSESNKFFMNFLLLFFEELQFFLVKLTAFSKIKKAKSMKQLVDPEFRVQLMQCDEQNIHFKTDKYEFKKIFYNFQ